MDSWETNYFGRDDELEWLKNHWRQTKNGTPRLLLLKGRTGVGKTRIAQELYRWLSLNYNDPDGYWPDSLEIGTSLSINPHWTNFNPTILITKTSIPFIWWGARWFNPEIRNLDDAQSGFERSRNSIELSLDIVNFLRYAQQEERDQLKKLEEEAGKLVLNVCGAELLIQLIETGKTVFDFSKSLFNRRNYDGMAVTHPSLRSQMRQEAFFLKLRQDLAAILDSRQSKFPSVPVVLFLDDAHWMDSKSVCFLHQLLNDARRAGNQCEKGWPLMVVATVWPSGYNNSPPDTCGQPPTHIAHIISRFKSQTDKKISRVFQVAVFDICPFKNYEPLRKLVRKALPGLAEDQVDKVLQNSGGNPQYVVELLRLLRQRKTLFVDRDISQALRAESLVNFERFTVNLTLDAIVRLRIANDEDMRIALFAGAVQGSTFNVMMVGELVKLLKYDCDAVIRALKRAYYPEALIKPVYENSGTTGSMLPSELPVRDFPTRWLAFPEPIYYTVVMHEANQDLLFEPLRVALIQRATAWFLEKKHHSFPGPERGRLLALISNVLNPIEKKTRDQQQAWGGSLFEYAEYLAEHGFFTEAANRLKMIHSPADWNDPLLEDHRDHLAASFLGPLLLNEFGIERVGNLSASVATSWPSLNRIVQSKIAKCIANLYRQRQDRQSLQNLAVAYYNVSKAFANVDREAAVNYIDKAVSCWERILEQYGRDRKSLSSLSALLDRYGDIVSDTDPDKATILFVEAFKIRDEIIRQYEHDRESFADFATSMHKVGKWYLDCPKKIPDLYDKAKEFIYKALTLRQEIVQQYGRNRKSLRALSASLGTMGCINWNEADQEEAEKLFGESLKLCQEIIDRFGRDRESLSDLSTAYERLIMVARDPKSKDVEKAFHSILQLHREDVESHGLDWKKIHDIKLLIDRVDSHISSSSTSAIKKEWGSFMLSALRGLPISSVDKLPKLNELNNYFQTMLE